MSYIRSKRQHDKTRDTEEIKSHERVWQMSGYDFIGEVGRAIKEELSAEIIETIFQINDDIDRISVIGNELRFFFAWSGDRSLEKSFAHNINDLNRRVIDSCPPSYADSSLIVDLIDGREIRGNHSVKGGFSLYEDTGATTIPIHCIVDRVLGANTDTHGTSQFVYLVYLDKDEYAWLSKMSYVNGKMIPSSDIFYKLSVFEDRRDRSTVDVKPTRTGFHLILYNNRKQIADRVYTGRVGSGEMSIVSTEFYMSLRDVVERIPGVFCWCESLDKSKIFIISRCIGTPEVAQLLIRDLKRLTSIASDKIMFSVSEFGMGDANCSMCEVDYGNLIVCAGSFVLRIKPYCDYPEGCSPHKVMEDKRKFSQRFVISHDPGYVHHISGDEKQSVLMAINRKTGLSMKSILFKAENQMKLAMYALYGDL